MGATWKHRLVEYNLDTMVGVCTNCGEVSLTLKDNRPKCPIARSEQRHRRRLNDHGLDYKSRQNRLLETDFACQSCGDRYSESTSYLNIDHCHLTKNVRGVLCRPCNLALGLLKDDPKRIRNLALYIERFR